MVSTALEEENNITLTLRCCKHILCKVIVTRGISEVHANRATVCCLREEDIVVHEKPRRHNAARTQFYIIQKTRTRYGLNYYLGNM